MSGDLEYKIATRFPPSLAAAANATAADEGMTMSAWVRKVIDQEIGRREGKCRTCGQPVADEPAKEATE